VAFSEWTPPPALRFVAIPFERMEKFLKHPFTRQRGVVRGQLTRHRSLLMFKKRLLSPLDQKVSPRHLERVLMNVETLPTVLHSVVMPFERTAKLRMLLH
jgi:hypothetical protein